MSQQIIKIMDHFWEQVAGASEYAHTQWAMSTYVKVQSFDKGTVTGLGLWGSNPVPFTIDFGINYDSLQFECDCQSFKQASKSQDTAPCAHLLRALIEIEAKIKQSDFNTIHAQRMNTIIPF